LIRVRILVPVLIFTEHKSTETMEKVNIFFKEAYDELLNKVTWPTWPQLQQSAMIVLIAALIISFIIVGMDLASKYAIQEGLYKFIRKG